MRLPDPRRSRVVLIGTSEYADKSLSDLPAIETTINTLAATLTEQDYGQAPQYSRHCVTMVNEGDLREVGHRLGTAAEEATDLLLVYYAGRILLDKRNRSLHLGLPDSDPRRPGFNSLEYAKLRDTVLDSPAAMKIIVLDCRLPDDIAGQLDTTGCYVLSSSFEEEVSRARPGEIHSAFSRHLISLLRDGVPGGPGLLRIEDIYFHLLKRMKQDGLPEPQSRGVFVESPLALIRNRAGNAMPRRLSTAGPTVGLIIAERTAGPPAFPDDTISPHYTEGPAKASWPGVPAPRVPHSEWSDAWMLDWLAGNADRLIEHLPAVAAEFLTNAVDSLDHESPRYAWFASRLASVLFRVGDLEQSQDTANLALDYTDDPDILVHLYSTLAQCLGITGSAADALPVLDQALSSPGLSARHRARLLVPAARTHFHLGEFTKASEVASDALEAATESGDAWARGWALHIIGTSHSAQGRLNDALPVYDQALTVAQANPALTDLKLLLQINKAATLGNLNRYGESLKVAVRARRQAEQVGTAIRAAQARSLLSEQFFETGQWDRALGEATTLDESLKEPAAACVNLGTIAVINFHRDDPAAARRALANAEPHAGRLGHRFVAQLALARSMDKELAGDTAGALAPLVAGLDGGTEERSEIEFLLPDAVRLAVHNGDDATAKRLTDYAVEVADGSRVPHRLGNELYAQGLTDSDPEKLLAAAARYEDATRPLYRAMALEAAARVFALNSDEEARRRGREAKTRSVEIYESLGATADVARVQAGGPPEDCVPRQVSRSS